MRKNLLNFGNLINDNAIEYFCMRTVKKEILNWFGLAKNRAEFSRAFYD